MSRTPTTDAPLLDALNAPPNDSPAEFTVTSLAQQLKRTLEDAFGVVRVRGEIGTCSRPASGHLYLTLKDEGAVLAAVCWRGQVARLGVKPEAGMDVVCVGRLTTYAGQSRYQLIIDRMELAGVGALLKMLEERKARLAAEGLFDSARKKPLPFLPEVIGVVTSPTGAVIRDILHRLRDRFPRRVIVWPTLVQGEGAAMQVAAAVRGFNALPPGGAVPRPSLIIVARGGGSLEDLMPFNDESVVRAVAESAVPVISAVGHETDTTLVDYAADARAPTPTAAAEMAVPVRSELISTVAEEGARLVGALRRFLHVRRERVGLLRRVLGEPARALGPLAQRLDDLTERLGQAAARLAEVRRGRLMTAAGRLRHPEVLAKLAAQRLESLSRRLEGARAERLQAPRVRLDRASALLEALSPRAVLGRGYALVRNADGGLVTRAAALAPGDSVGLELQDGTREAVIRG